MPDQTRLSNLDSDELHSLCEEVAESWPYTGDPVSCGDGWTVSFTASSAEGCGDLDVTTCSATAGDVRACNEALLADPCAAAEQRPAACAPLAAGGCGEDTLTVPVYQECPALQPFDVPAIEGVYELVKHTDNSLSCSAEGESVLNLDAQHLFTVVASDFFGSAVGVITSCADMTACRAEIQRIREYSKGPAIQAIDPATPTPELRRTLQCETPIPGVLSGGGGTVGPRIEGDCQLSSSELTASRTADGTLRLENRTSAWTQPQEDGWCKWTRGNQPSDAVCSRLEVYEGRLLAPL